VIPKEKPAPRASQDRLKGNQNMNQLSNFPHSVNNNPQPPLWHALALAAAGYACFPMSRAKTPLKGSHGVRDASTDPDRLRALFADPRAELVAVACGVPSGISVLDIDKQHDGLAWWQAHRHRLPTTWAWRTRSGGVHVAMKHPPGLRTVAIGQIGTGIEIRSTGASAIYWPAIGLPTLCDAPPAAWPEWLVPPPKPAYVPSDAPPRVADDAAIDRLIRFVAQAGQGQRNARLYWAGCRMRELTGTGTLSRRDAIEILTETGTRIGLDRTEAHRTARSAIEGGRS
jgi:hypothetical protein